ncbi:MAG: hypothetical protein R2796_04395 [Chitinophagaceae bacterium]
MPASISPSGVSIFTVHALFLIFGAGTGTKIAPFANHRIAEIAIVGFTLRITEDD